MKTLMKVIVFIIKIVLFFINIVLIIPVLILEAARCLLKIKYSPWGIYKNVMDWIYKKLGI